MKHLRKMACLMIMIFAFSISISAKVLANTINPESINSDGFQVRVIDKSELPKGVQPLEFKNDEEAQEYLNKIKAQIKSDNELSQKMKLDRALNKSEQTTQINSSLISPLASGRKTKTASWGIGNGITSLQVVVNYSYSGNYFTAVNSVTSGLTGVTMGFGWTQSGYYTQFLDSSRHLGVDFWGTLDSYLLVNGVIKIYSSYIEHYGEFGV